MEIKRLKGNPATTVRVTLSVSYADLKKVEKFSPSKLTYVDSETKKVTFEVFTDCSDIKPYGLGVKAAAATPDAPVCINYPTTLDKDDLGAIATKLEAIETAVVAAKGLVDEASTKIVDEE